MQVIFTFIFKRFGAKAYHTLVAVLAFNVALAGAGSCVLIAAAVMQGPKHVTLAFWNQQNKSRQYFSKL